MEQAGGNMNEYCLLIPCPCMDECARRGLRLCDLSEDDYHQLEPLGDKSLILVGNVWAENSEFLEFLAELLSCH
jgi:hypothetical protein